MTDTRSVLVVEYSVLVTMGSAWHTSAALIHMYLFHICMCVLWLWPTLGVCLWFRIVCVRLWVVGGMLLLPWYTYIQIWNEYIHIWNEYIQIWNEYIQIWNEDIQIWNEDIQIWNEYMCIRAAAVCHALPIVSSTWAMSHIIESCHVGMSCVICIWDIWRDCCSVLQCVACITVYCSATHCNTLQHTATHRNTLQHTATASYIHEIYDATHANVTRLVYMWHCLCICDIIYTFVTRLIHMCDISHSHVWHESGAPKGLGVAGWWWVSFQVRGSVWQCVAVCCSVLQCVAVCCSVLRCVAVCCGVLRCAVVWPDDGRSLFRCVVVFCFVLQCVAVCCSVLQCDQTMVGPSSDVSLYIALCVAVRCSMVQYVAVCCSVLQCGWVGGGSLFRYFALCCSVSQYGAV